MGRTAYFTEKSTHDIGLFMGVDHIVFTPAQPGQGFKEEEKIENKLGRRRPGVDRFNERGPDAAENPQSCDLFILPDGIGD
jgi:hypothetical protein